MILFRYLEYENSRLREFYTKKIEKLQKKYQNQVHVLKRGQPLLNNNNNNSNSNNNNGSNNININSEGKQEDKPLDPNQLSLHHSDFNPSTTQLINENLQLNEKIKLLEDELLQTAEELGRIKAVTFNVMSSTPSIPMIPNDSNNQEKIDLMNRINQLELEIKRIQDDKRNDQSNNKQNIDLSAWKEHENKLYEEMSVLKFDLAESTRLQDKYYEKIKEYDKDNRRKENEINELQSEILQLKDELRKPQTPKMQQFLVSITTPNLIIITFFFQ